ncbi:MAG TPA: Ig-like domain-containing protein [Candidatus Dormibacteraeota bacterium]|nr:Ig-like domain-containing protein [Candidatus Dormibacteraeota bacterium]
MRLIAGAAGCGTLLVSLIACGGSPPQIIDYSPQRGAVDVSTAAPITIAFDHAVDQASVEGRLHLVPSTDGVVRWDSARQLSYEHSGLRASTTYEVILDAGYQDLAGNTYSLRHHWSFVTEGPPNLAGSTPSDYDTGIDPAAYLALAFTREMNPASLRSAITLRPNIPFDVRLDPTDGHRAIIAPSQLLSPNIHYELSINTAALDIDGNQLGRDQTIHFTTGPPRVLRHWLAFATNATDGTPGGLWIVNETGFPRQVFNQSPVRSFSWSPAGDRLLIQGSGETWSEFVPGSSTVQLNFKGIWAAALASGMGYVFIDDAGVLHRASADGPDEVIATDVAQATVAPNGLRVVFVQGALAPNVVWGYDVGLRARYQLALDTGPVSDVSWAPSGNRIAYLRTDTAGAISLRVRNLTGPGTTTTVATGDLGSPAWLPDSTHVVFAALAPGAVGSTHKAFVVNIVAPPAALNPASGLPSDPTIDLAAPVPSPDGHQIAFVSGNQVWLMNADGTRPTALTRFDPASFPYSCRAPAWTKA